MFKISFYEDTIGLTDELEKTQTKIAAVIIQRMFQKEPLKGVEFCHLVALKHFVKYHIDISSYRLFKIKTKVLLLALRCKLGPFFG